MSTSLSQVEQIEFDALVKAEYRSQGFLLRDGCRMRNDVIGASIEFRKVDQVIAVPTGYLQSVTIQDPNYTKQTAILQKYTAPTAVDSVQELTVNFDTKMENAMLVAQALGRRSDQIEIDALADDPGDTIVDGGTNMTYLKYTKIMEFFENNAVPLSDRFVAMSASNFRSLLQAEQFTNSLFTSNRVLDNAMVKQFLGINLITIPQMAEGGLPKTGNIRTALAWHKQAIGMGIGHNFRTEINYLPKETSWLINGIFSAGAVVIDNRGVLAVNCDESV